jgi:hypothetical protein
VPESILNMFSANLSDKTGMSGFDSSNSTASFVKLVSEPSLGDIKGLSIGIRVKSTY